MVSCSGGICSEMGIFEGTEHDDILVLYKALICLRKLCIQLFFQQLWANSRADLALYPWYDSQFKRNLLIQTF